MRCPVCKADNNEGPACRRCKADLSLLFLLEEQRANALIRARRALAEGHLDEALDEAERARGLRAGPDAHRLIAVIYLLLRDFEQAWTWYRISRWTEPAPTAPS